jgi:copper(I)-binding protein
MRTAILPALLAALAVAACGDRKTSAPPTAVTSRSMVTVSAWIRLPARPDLPASGYFDATAEGKVGPLVSVSADNSRIEMHESMNHGGMGSMQPIDGAAFDQGRMTFAPGGKHLMLYGLAPGLKAGGTIPLVFHFQGQSPFTVKANLVGPGDPEPGGWRLAH